MKTTKNTKNKKAKQPGNTALVPYHGIPLSPFSSFVFLVFFVMTLFS